MTHRLDKLPKFKPHPAFKGGGLQTLATQFGRPQPTLVPDEQFELALADGDKLTVAVNRPSQPQVEGSAKLPRVVLVHGLTGDADAYYLQRAARKLNQAGFEVWRMNHRGAGPLGLKLARGFAHAGRSADLEAVVRFAAERGGARKVLVAAFSLSANMLLRWLGAAGHDDALAGGPPPPKPSLARWRYALPSISARVPKRSRNRVTYGSTGTTPDAS